MQIAPWNGGQIYIKYRRVDCTPPGSIRIELMNVNGDYNWLRLTAQASLLHLHRPEHACCGSDIAPCQVQGHSVFCDAWAADEVTHVSGFTCRRWEALAASQQSR